MRRAAVSIPANISEGFGKRTTPEKLRFFNIAEGSIEESKYYLILSRDLHYGEVEKLQDALQTVAKLLAAYHRTIANPAYPKRKSKRRRRATGRRHRP
jgi:four helix bundle protein